MKIALCCIAKCENLYLSEWINHHLNLGFDHIYIYDNNDTDGEKCEDVVGKENPNVTVLKYFIGKKQKGCETQIASYNDFYQRFGGKYDWVLYLDVDEFLVLNGYENVCGYIKDITKPSTKSVRLNWKCYDDNDNLHYECLPVRERFTRVCEDETLSYYKKHFYKTKLTGFKAINVHYSNIRGDVVDCDGKYATYSTFVTSDTYNHSKAYIAHYATKSADEYYMIKKKRRGGGIGNDRLSIEHFFKYNKRTEEKERYLTDLFAGKVEKVKFEESKVAVVNEKPTEGISVCITAYKSQDFIEECLDSVAEQTWFKTHNNWEVIVGIDGCERTLLKMKEIMHKYKNLRVLMMDSNKGTYVTSNTIIKEAKYDWILRFDSDDKMRPYTISSIMENATQYNFIRFGFENFGNCKIEKPYGMSYGVVLFEKSVFCELGGYRDWRCGGDADFMRRIRYTDCKLYEDQRILFDRRIHENSLTQDKKTNFDSELRKNTVKMVKKTDYSVYANRISDFVVNDFTEIKKDDGICKNITNLKNATDKDIEDFLKNRASKSRFNLQIDFENPKTVQDKLHWLMVYDKNKMLKAKCADKILLHDYSIKKLGKDICVPIIDVYNKPEDINFDKLPNKYVLKCNHGYAMNIICTDNKNNEFLNIKNRKINTRKDCVDFLNTWLDTNFGDKYYQWHYALIEPKCYSEVFMDDGNESLVDYKVWCCNGEPKMIMVISDRYSNNLHENIYDTDWNTFDIGWSCARQDFNNLDKKPVNLDEMLDYSRKLSKDFDFVRVDFYIVNDKLYLGELTFTPNGGIFGCRDYETSLYWGDMINITSF